MSVTRYPMTVAGEHALREELHRLKTIDRFREARLRRPGSFELVPERAMHRSLVGRKQSEQPLSRDLLTIRLGHCADPVEQGRVAAIDLNQVMYQKHRHDTQRIDRLNCVMYKDKSEECDMPAMLGGILASRAIANPAAANHRLETICLDQETKLRRQGFAQLAEPNLVDVRRVRLRHARLRDAKPRTTPRIKYARKHLPDGIGMARDHQTRWRSIGEQM